MERQIVFRGKRKDNGKWIHGDLQLGDGDHIPMIGEVCGGHDPVYYQVDEKTIGQFTGLWDKDRAPIYEGDILRYPPNNKWEETNFVSYEVFFHDNDCCERHIGWQMNRHHFHGCIGGTSDFRDFKPATTERMVIIGNIHDNPALLKGGEM